MDMAYEPKGIPGLAANAFISNLVLRQIFGAAITIRSGKEKSQHIRECFQKLFAE